MKNTQKMMHIHLDGRRTGDILLLYKVDGCDIDLDLRLYNITDHTNLDRTSNSKYVNRQSLHSFDVILNKFTPNQISYAEECYLGLISDYEFHQKSGQDRKDYSEQYLKDYFESVFCSDELSFEDFLQIIDYLENKYKRKIYGSLDFSRSQHTLPITEREEKYILEVIQDYGADIIDAYIETEVDEYGDSYEYMYVITCLPDRASVQLLEDELYSLEPLFKITVEVSNNDSGRYGRTYMFSHYFA